MKEVFGKKLDEFITTLYEEEKSKKTIQSYKQEIQTFINWLTEDVIIDKKLMIDFKNFLQTKYEPATVNHYIVVMNKFLTYCEFENIKVKKLKIQERSSLNDQLEDQEHKRMLRWAKKLGLDDMYLIIKLFAKSGLRVDELKFFTVENLDWHMEVKNKGKYREIIIPRELVREIKKYCKENKIRSGYIFRAPRDKFKQIPTTTLWDRLKRIAKAAKINPNKVHAHAWRHLFAKAAKRAGVDLDELKDLLGHNNLATTAIYTKTSSKDKREKLEKIKY